VKGGKILITKVLMILA